MSYENRYKLTLLGTESVSVPFCDNCNEFRTGKFCSECGETLSQKETQLDSAKIISELRDSSESVDYALEDSCSGHNVEEDIQEFSTKYPDIVFQLDITWDSGFGDPPSRYYFKNGVKQDATPKISYDIPKF